MGLSGLGLPHLSTRQHHPPPPPTPDDVLATPAAAKRGGVGLLMGSFLVLVLIAAAGVATAMARERRYRVWAKQWAVRAGFARQHSRVATTDDDEYSKPNGRGDSVEVAEEVEDGGMKRSFEEEEEEEEEVAPPPEEPPAPPEPLPVEEVAPPPEEPRVVSFSARRASKGVRFTLPKEEELVPGLDAPANEELASPRTPTLSEQKDQAVAFKLKGRSAGVRMDD